MRRLLLALAALLTQLAIAQENLKPTDYGRVEQMIPMRDGTRLHTVICAPQHSAHPLPFLIRRTPYGVDDAAVQSESRILTGDGVIWVFQDIRGRYKSEGTFVMMRPTRFNSNAKADEGTDAYDTVDWLLKNVPNNNGKAGIWGTSYDGWTALQAAVQPHPALKVAVPMASPLDMWSNDDFHRNGAFRLSYGFEYSYMMETSHENEQFDFHGQDAFDYYLKLGPLSSVNENVFHNRLPTWNAFVAHPDHDPYWISQSVANLLEKGPQLPIINVGGYWDQEDPWGPQESYRLLSRRDPHHWNHIILGPWNHGGWMGSGTALGKIDFGSDTASYFRKDLLYPTILHYIKGRDRMPLAAATVFVTGSNQWRSFASWPPKHQKQYSQALKKDGRLESRPSRAQGEAVASYVSDPTDPVPYRQRPIEATYEPKGSGWYTWQVQDQSFLDGRKDVASFATAPLGSDRTIIGEAGAELVCSTTGTDSDWVVKLIDEYPADDPKLPNYKLPIAMEVVRSRFLGVPPSGPVHKREPGVPYPVAIDLHAVAHTFLKGHRMLVQVQSTWFPLIDRNPQTFVENIFLAKPDDFKAATQTIYEPSYIELPESP